MMSEVFSKAMPVVVTSAFASHFVLMLAAGNLGGRLGKHHHCRDSGC